MAHNNNNKIIFLLIGILFVALFLRIYSLDKVPVSLTMDEAAIAYNSYSILTTGKDEFGTKFPLAFRSVGDYKPPLLIYAELPAILVFGLTEFGARITVALFGAFSVLLVYKLISLWVGKRSIALLTALLVAVSPWHIKFSRSSFEAILALFLVLAGAAVFFFAVKNRGKKLWLSALLYALSLYAYHAERVFTPVFVLGLIIIYRKELFCERANFIKAFVVGTLVVLPILFVMLDPLGSIRAQSTFITRDFELNRILHKEGEMLSLQEMVFDNNYILSFLFWSRRYLDYFNPSFLFVDALELTLPKSPNIGLLYLLELPFSILGFYVIAIRGRLVDKKDRMAVFWWLIIGPLAASLANNPRHPLRSLTLVPILHLFSATGVWFVYKAIKSISVKKIFVGGWVAGIIISMLYFMDLYFIHYQLTYSEYMMDGWKKAAIYAVENKDNYREIIIDPRFGTQGPYTVGTPYLYVLFYGKIDPKHYQSDPRRREFASSSNFDNFTFREINWAAGEGTDKDKSENLFIGSKWVLPANEAEILEKFYLYNGKEILRAASPAR